MDTPNRRIFKIPLSVQRYEWVKDYIISNAHIKSVTDFGCGSGHILNWLKNCPNIEQINFVDNDISLLEHQLNYNFQPLLCEMLIGRDSSVKDLNIKVYHANMTIPDERLKADCITMVEVIEHLHMDEVERATRAIFAYYQPKMVIITTPNSEFNHLFQDRPGATKFRHHDHKFEWTRLEFDQWARGVSSLYPYSYRMDGVGHLPGSGPYGPCTQIAIFTRFNDEDLQANTATREGNLNKDLHCIDLLLDKLNVKNGVPDWQFDAGQKKVSLMTEYTIPGTTNPESNRLASKPFDWGTMDVS